MAERLVPMKSFCARWPRGARLKFPRLAIAARNNSTRRRAEQVHAVNLTAAPDNAFHLFTHVFIAQLLDGNASKTANESINLRTSFDASNSHGRTSAKATEDNPARRRWQSLEPAQTATAPAFICITGQSWRAKTIKPVEGTTTKTVNVAHQERVR